MEDRPEGEDQRPGAEPPGPADEVPRPVDGPPPPGAADELDLVPLEPVDEDDREGNGPEEEGDPRAAAWADVPAAPPPVLPRRVIWLLLLALGLAWYGATEGRAELYPHQLEAQGLLTRQLIERPGAWWRLVRGSFVHGNPILLGLSCLLVWIMGGAVERRAGGGAVLFLFVAVGAGLNGLRVAIEPDRALFLFAGGWPGALALGGAALALGLRTREGALGLLLTLAIELAILFGISAADRRLEGAPLGVSMLASIGAGFAFGLLLPLRGARAPTGCLLALVSLTLLGMAELGRALDGHRLPWGRRPPAGADRPPLPGDPPPPVATTDTRLVRLVPLGVELELPASWDYYPTRNVPCPACKAQVKVDEPEERLSAERPERPEVPCPACQKPFRPPPPGHVLYTEQTYFARNLTFQLWTRPRHPFDAPDTLLGNALAQLGENSPLSDPLPVADERWPGAPSGHLLALEGRWGDRPTLHRIYLVVGPERLVRIDALVPLDGDPGEQQRVLAWVEAAARSLRELDD